MKNTIFYVLSVFTLLVSCSKNEDPALYITRFEYTSVEGCEVMHYGFDRNNNGYLDSREILHSINIGLCPGSEGLSAYELAVEAGFEGTLEEWLNSLQGEDGVDGEDGEDGQHGTSFSVQLINENNCYTLVLFENSIEYDRFTVCNGLDGENGEDGTDGINGEDGSDGQDGSSFTAEIVDCDSCNGFILILYQDGVEYDRIVVCYNDRKNHYD